MSKALPNHADVQSVAKGLCQSTPRGLNIAQCWRGRSTRPGFLAMKKVRNDVSSISAIDIRYLLTMIFHGQNHCLLIFKTKSAETESVELTALRWPQSR